MTDNTHRADSEPADAPTYSPLVVFGRDGGGKPHASRFEAADAALAERAAGLMGMRVLRLSTDAEAALADKLPAGRIFASGRAFVPFVRGAIFAQLDTAPNAFAPPRPTDAAVPRGGPAKGKGSDRMVKLGQQPSGALNATSEPGEPLIDWNGIAVGHAVLAAEEGDVNTWYLAVVVGRRDDDLFQLRWGGEWADEPLFVRRREHLALLPPDTLLLTVEP